MPTSGFVDKRTGRPIGNREAMVMQKPNGGWLVHFVVNGVPVSVAGSTPADAIAKERLIVAQNGLEEQWDEDEAWRQANLQWLDSTDPKYHRIEITDLLKSPMAEEVVHDGRDYPPKVWGSIAWNWLGLLLAKDRYDAPQFIKTFKELVDMLNPAICPTLGCDACHVEASKKLVELQRNPPKTISEARRFLWTFHNEVNARIEKPILTFEQAEKANLWR